MPAPELLSPFTLSLIALLGLLAVLLLLAARRAGALRTEVAAAREALVQAQHHTDLSENRLAEREARLEEVRAERDAARMAADTLRAELTDARSESAERAEAVKRLEARAAEAAEAHAALSRKLEDVQAELRRSEADHKAYRADAEARAAATDEKLTELRQLRETMAREFEELANKTLRRTGEDFSKSHEAKLKELLTPFREHVGRFEEELRNVHQSADKERVRLGEQIRLLTQRSEAISQEATNLTRALKGDKQRQGAWGEMILERILEDSGLERDLHYEVQTQRRDEHGGRWRPDLVVKMPRGKCLVVDSKVSLVDYEASTRAEDEQERRDLVRRHTAAVRRHIDQLAEKGYQQLDSGTVDYVLMFMPIEGALSEALREQGDLTSYALNKGVGIMTPTTLMVALRTVEHIWTVERRESNAEMIADRAGKLYDKMASFVSSMENVGKHLDSARSAHDQALGQLCRGRGNAIGQIEKLRQMGARNTKTLGIAHDAAEDDEDEDGAAALPRPAAE